MYKYILIESSIFIHVDINECSKNNGGCNHICHNTVTSYYCSCNDYGELDVDNHTCIGITTMSLLSFIYQIITDNNFLITNIDLINL